MRTVLKALLLAPLFLAPTAHATVFKCISADGGVIYTNERANARDCTALKPDLPVSTIPAPSRPAGAQPSAATPGPRDFPRVSRDAQQSRDNTRRQILENELDAERQALEAATGRLDEALAQGESSTLHAGQDSRLQPYRDQVELHERNIEALTRELRALK